MPERDELAPGAERDGDNFAVRVRLTREQALQLIRRGGVDYGDRPHFRESGQGLGLLDLLLSREQIGNLRREGYEVEILSNQSARGRERLSQVGRGDRFEGGRIAPRGIGRKVGRDHDQGRQPPDPAGPKAEA